MNGAMSETDVYCREYRDELSISWRILGKDRIVVEYRPPTHGQHHPVARQREDWASDDDDLDLPEEEPRVIPRPEDITWRPVRLESYKESAKDCEGTDQGADASLEAPVTPPGLVDQRSQSERGPDTESESPAPSLSQQTSHEKSKKTKVKKRRRGKKSEEKRQKKKRNPPPGLSLAQARFANIVRTVVLRTSFLLSDNFSLNTSARIASTGWHGVPPPKAELEELIARFRDGSLNQRLRHFHRLAFDPNSKSPTVLLDCKARAFALRTTTAHFIEKMQVELCEAMTKLMAPSLRDDGVRKTSELKNPRGDHFQCLMGHQRPYHDTIILVRWHKDNEQKVLEFLGTPCVRKLIVWVNWVLRAFFPDIAARYERCAKWHEEKYGIGPLFGLFWNFCINGIFPHQLRIHTVPHGDPKNVVGMCVVFVYVLPGFQFNPKLRSWFVIFDAGIIIELPPWVGFYYPSSAFIHFNYDISDIEIIHTSDGSRPTRSHSRKNRTVGPQLPEEAHGRGSIVFFSQGNLFSSSETGFPTLGAARRAGHAGATDVADNFNKYYPSYGTFVPV